MNRIINFINNNGGRADFVGTIPESWITKTEDKLKVKFPPSYVYFLKHLGCGDFDGYEYYGIITNPDIESKSIPSVIFATLESRKYGLPPSHIVVASSDYGPDYVIDTSQIDDRSESPVLLWSDSYPIEKVANSFEEFMADQLAEVGFKG